MFFFYEWRNSQLYKKGKVQQHYVNKQIDRLSSSRKPPEDPSFRGNRSVMAKPYDIYRGDDIL